MMALRIVRAVALTGALSGTSGCAHSLCDPEPAGWQAVRSENFIIHTDAYAPRYEFLADRLERIYAAFAGTPLFGALPEHWIEVVLFDDPSQFTDHFGFNRESMTLHGVGTAGRRAGVMVFHTQTSEDQMAHALAHHLARAGDPQMPLWLEEGLASYVETVIVLDGVSRFGLRPPRLKEVALGRIVKIDELVAATWEDFDGDRRGRYTGTASTLVDLLVAGIPGRLRPAWTVFRETLAGGAAASIALAAAWPQLLNEDLDDLMDRYVRTRRTPNWVGFRPHRFMPGVKVSHASAADLRSLCIGCSSLGQARREGWPDFVPGR